MERIPTYRFKCRRFYKSIFCRGCSKALLGVRTGEYQNGMSMIEILIMTAIMIVLTSILVGGVPIFNETIYVKTEAERLALDLRRTQSNAILGYSAPGAGITPLYWGLHVDLANPGQFLVFADTNGNRQYNAGTDEILRTVRFENATTITALTSPLGGETELNFFFIVPYGDTEIFNGTGSVGSWGKITLASPKRAITRTVTMRVSGQISIANN